MQMEVGGYWIVVAQDGSGSRPLTKQEATTSALKWAGVLMVGALVLLVVWGWARKALLGTKNDAAPGSIMEDLRKMREQGQITQEEYDNVRKNMAARLARSGFGAEKSSTDRLKEGPEGSKSR